MTARTLIAFLAIATALAPLSSAAQAMSNYKWKMRPLVVFAPSENDTALVRQRRIVATLRPAFQDRKIVVVYVTGDKVSSELGPGPGLGAAALRARYGVDASAFRALLVGKDGEIKLSSGSPIAASTLFSTIDAMPMRQTEQKEMRRK